MRFGGIVTSFVLVAGCSQAKTNDASNADASVDASMEASVDAAAPGPPRVACASSSEEKCLFNCAANEDCFTQVACGFVDASTVCHTGEGNADDRCHPSCKSDSDCPTGERCRDISFFGCYDFNGGKRICCRGDGDGGCE